MASTPMNSGSPAAKPFIKPITLPPASKPFVPVAVTPAVTVAAPKKDTIEDDYLGTITPEPKLPLQTMQEMQAGRDTLARHAESRLAALQHDQK